MGNAVLRWRGTVHVRTPGLKLPSTMISPQQSPGGWFIRAKDADAPVVFFLHTQQVLASTATSHLNVLLQAQEAVHTASEQEDHVLEMIVDWEIYRRDLNPSLLSAMEANVLIVELILSYMSHATATVEQATFHVKWLNKPLLDAVKNTTASGSEDEAVDQQLHNLLFQLQFLLNMPLGAGLIVPRLQYSTYSKLVNTMAHMAESYDKEFKQMTLFIEQNEVLGTYLLQQNKAFAEKEKEMEVFHSELHKVKKDDLTRALAKMEQLEVDMREMTAAMQQAEEDMEAGLIRYRNIEVARAVFSVLGAIAQLALAVFTGGATAGAAVAGAGNAVNQVTGAASSLRRVAETLEKLLLVTEFLVAMKGLFDAVNEIHELPPDVPLLPDLPSEAEWAIFENEIEAAAAGMPEEVSEVLTWKAKCKNVAALGREMVTLAAVIGQVQYDIKVHDLLRQVAQNHADRLKSIQPVDLKNYQEMATQLDMRTTRVLLGLLEVLSLQNAALQYQFLLPPSPLTTTSTAISISDVWTLLLQQEVAAVLSLAYLGFSSDRVVTYLVKGIPVRLLLDGEDWDFPISVKDVEDFPAGWSRVRISYLEMNFVTASDEEVHQPTTDTGKVYMVLRGEQLLADRKRGEHLKYEAAMPVEYQYAYCLHTGRTTESNRPTEECANLFMRMTPFTRWKLRLSATAAENRGLAFPTATATDATTQIAIHFHVSAIRTVD
eukprot:c43438_g1_i1 orf=359-2509(+)